MNQVSDVSSRVDRYIDGSETSFHSLEKDHVGKEVSKSCSKLKLTKSKDNTLNS